MIKTRNLWCWRQSAYSCFCVYCTSSTFPAEIVGLVKKWVSSLLNLLLQALILSFWSFQGKLLPQRRASHASSKVDASRGFPRGDLHLQDWHLVKLLSLRCEASKRNQLGTMKYMENDATWSADAISPLPAGGLSPVLPVPFYCLNGGNGIMSLPYKNQKVMEPASLAKRKGCSLNQRYRTQTTARSSQTFSLQNQPPPPKKKAGVEALQSPALHGKAQEDCCLHYKQWACVSHA